MSKRQPNPNHGKFQLPEGYIDIGFINGASDQIIKLIDEVSSHESGKQTEEFDNSRELYRGTDIIKISHEHKLIWHVDMSD